MRPFYSHFLYLKGFSEVFLKERFEPCWHGSERSEDSRAKTERSPVRNEVSNGAKRARWGERASPSKILPKLSNFMSLYQKPPPEKRRG